MRQIVHLRWLEGAPRSYRRNPTHVCPAEGRARVRTLQGALAAFCLSPSSPESYRTATSLGCSPRDCGSRLSRASSTPGKDSKVTYVPSGSWPRPELSSASSISDLRPTPCLRRSGGRGLAPDAPPPTTCWKASFVGDWLMNRCVRSRSPIVTTPCCCLSRLPATSPVTR